MIGTAGDHSDRRHGEHLSAVGESRRVGSRCVSRRCCRGPVLGSPIGPPPAFVRRRERTDGRCHLARSPSGPVTRTRAPTAQRKPTTEVDTGMSWWHSYRSVSRDELLAGALALADRGWPVVPGTFWQGRRWAGMPDAPRSGCVPVLTDGLVGATCDRGAIVEWWSKLPYTVLLPTGSALDAI